MQGQKPIAPQLQSFNTRVNDINLDSTLDYESREFGPQLQLGPGAYGATFTAHVTAAGASLGNEQGRGHHGCKK